LTRANGSKPDDPLDELDDVIAELEGSEWADEEITAEHYIHAEPGSTVIVDQTGKHRPVKADDRPTPSDPPSQPAKARFALAVLDRIQPPWLRAPVVLFALAIVGLLVWRGVALTGIVP
jgi:hypothetical protein